MNTTHIAIGTNFSVPIGSTALCSPNVINIIGGRHRSEMRFWSIDKDYAFKDCNIDQPTFIIIINPAQAPSLYWTTDNDGTWCHVLVQGELRLFKLRWRDIVNGHIKIIDEKAS